MNPQPPTIVVHLEDLDTLLMISKYVHCSMHMIFHSKPIPSSAELAEFLYISCRQKLLHPLLAPLSAGDQGHMSPVPLPAATAKISNHYIDLLNNSAVNYTLLVS